MGTKRRKRAGGRPHSPEKRARAAELCAAGMTNDEVATEIGLHRNTIAKWRAEEDFAADIEAMHHEVREASQHRLKRAVGMAVDTLVKLLTRGDEAPTQRGAALDILKLVGMQPPDDVNVKVTRASALDLSKLTDDELAQLEALQRKLGDGDDPEEE